MQYMLIKTKDNQPTVLYVCSSKEEMKKFVNALERGGVKYEGSLSVVTYDGE